MTYYLLIVNDNSHAAGALHVRTGRTLLNESSPFHLKLRFTWFFKPYRAFVAFVAIWLVHLTFRNAPNNCYVINMSSFSLPLRSNWLTSGGGLAGAFHDIWREISRKFHQNFRSKLKMPQYKIVNEETGNMYVFNLSEEDYLHASKGKYFFNILFFRWILNLQEARKVRSATCRKIMRQFMCIKLNFGFFSFRFSILYSIIRKSQTKRKQW